MAVAQQGCQGSRRLIQSYLFVLQINACGLKEKNSRYLGGITQSPLVGSRGSRFEAWLSSRVEALRKPTTLLWRFLSQGDLSKLVNWGETGRVSHNFCT